MPLSFLPEDLVKVMHCRVLFLQFTQAIELGRVVVVDHGSGPRSGRGAGVPPDDDP